MRPGATAAVRWLIDERHSRWNIAISMLTPTIIYIVFAADLVARIIIIPMMPRDESSSSRDYIYDAYLSR